MINYIEALNDSTGYIILGDKLKLEICKEDKVTSVICEDGTILIKVIFDNSIVDIPLSNIICWEILREDNK